MLGDMRSYLNGKKPIIMTIHTFQEMFEQYSSNEMNNFFKHFYPCFSCHSYDVLKTEYVDMPFGKLLYEHWLDWGIFEEEMLDLLRRIANEECPDDTMFCSQNLYELYEANRIIPNDMIYTIGDLARFLE